MVSSLRVFLWVVSQIMEVPKNTGSALKKNNYEAKCNVKIDMHHSMYIHYSLHHRMWPGHVGITWTCTISKSPQGPGILHFPFVDWRSINDYFDCLLWGYSLFSVWHRDTKAHRVVVWTLSFSVQFYFNRHDKCVNLHMSIKKETGWGKWNV